MLADVRALRRRIHQAPEIGWQEHRTSAAIVGALPGLTVEPIAGTGLLVRTGSAGTPAIGVRAELDALPLAEQTGASFASATGVMHACGHDVHMSALVALLRAFALATAATPAPAALLGVFQPSEEASPSGAVRITETGRLQEQHLAAMLAVHLHPDVPWGAVTTGEGAVNAGSDSFVLTVTGAGGHGAYPHRSHDPVLALSQVVVALQQVVSRRTDPMHPTVLSVCRLQAGSAANVIPTEALAEGTVRVLIPDDRQEILDLIASVTENTATAYGCLARVEFTLGDPPLVNDRRLVSAVDPWLDRSGFGAAEPMRSCGSDDFAVYREVAPSLMMFLGLRGHDGDSYPALHHPAFLPPEDAVEQTARAMLAAYAGAAELIIGTG